MASSQVTGSQPGSGLPEGHLGKRKLPEGSRSGSGSLPAAPPHRSATPSTAGASKVVGAKKKKKAAPKPRLEKVPTHLDKAKSESKADQIQYQEDLIV